MSKGYKKDQGKPQIALVPPELIWGVAEVLTLNVPKYGARNWELGMDWDRPYSALQRHMLAWWQGDSLDGETKLSHLLHAACNISFLIAYEQRKIGKDNRPKHAPKTL